VLSKYFSGRDASAPPAVEKNWPPIMPIVYTTTLPVQGRNDLT